MEINLKFSFNQFLNKWAYLAMQGELRSRQTAAMVGGRGMDPRRQGGLQGWVLGTEVIKYTPLCRSFCGQLLCLS